MAEQPTNAFDVKADRNHEDSTVFEVLELGPYLESRENQLRRIPELSKVFLPSFLDSSGTLLVCHGYPDTEPRRALLNVSHLVNLSVPLSLAKKVQEEARARLEDSKPVQVKQGDA